MENFQSRARGYLELYKRQVLNIERDGTWQNRPYPHILPPDLRQQNILPTIRDGFWAWFDGAKIRLHKNFHHLNSSQALCFNLFFPFLSAGPLGLDPVVEALDVQEPSRADATFEFVPDRAEGTNFDFTIPLQSGSRLYFEIKYSEQEFGTATSDVEHLEKFRKIYCDRNSERFEPMYCSAEAFLKNYQILRNLWHLRPDSQDLAIFLFPKSNRCLSNQRMS